MSKALFISTAIVFALMICGLVSKLDPNAANLVTPQGVEAQTKQIEELQAEVNQLRAQVATLQQQNRVLAEALGDEQDDLRRVIAASETLRTENERLALELANYQQAMSPYGQPQAQLVP